MRKFLLTISFLISFGFISRSQSISCSTYIKTEFDKFTGDETISMKTPLTIGINGIKYGEVIALLSPDKDHILLSFFVTKKLSCIEAGMVYFLFEDGSRLKRYSWLKYNCDGNFSVEVIENSKFNSDNYNDISPLKDKNVSLIRLSCSDGSLDFELSKSQRNTLKNSINCLFQLTKR